MTFGQFKTDSDPAPLFFGRPDERCQCPHWGYLLSGKIVFRDADHIETYVACDAFYVPPATYRSASREPRSSSPARRTKPPRPTPWSPET